jgi:hypothetical protein
VTVGRSAEPAGFLECLGSRRPGRHLACLLEGVHRAGVVTAVIRGDHAFLLFAHGLSGWLEFATQPLADAGFHRVLRYGRGLNTTALLAFKCSAVEASGSRLDLGEKHSLVIACRAARPLDRREVGRGDRLIFAHGSSLRRERYELPVTDNCRAQAVIIALCGWRDLTRWSILLIFQNLCLAGLDRDARRWRRSCKASGGGRRS